MIKWFCDKCKKEMKEDFKHLSFKNERKEYTLCKDCRKLFYKWINE